MSEISGRQFIAGRWTASGEETFSAVDPSSGQALPDVFFNATLDEVDAAARAAADAFDVFSRTPIKDRAAFLRAIGREIDARGDALTAAAHAETALPEARLHGERGRTVGQLGLFADWIEDGQWLDARIDTALPERVPLPRPDIRSVNMGLGPVVVFGASNFPLAFSTAGGDTASALAAGCPVIVKAHPAHPATSELVAQAIEAAIAACGVPAGAFALLQGAGFEAGQGLVTHPAVKAGGFTGSLRGGRALFDLAMQRPEPIPFYAEMGSNNPMFLLPSVMATHAEQIALGWVQSLTMGVGQFCTNPGMVVVRAGPDAETFQQAAVAALQDIAPAPMLTRGIAAAFGELAAAFSSRSGVATLIPPQGEDFCVGPAVFSAAADDWLADDTLSEEMFGPGGIVIVCRSEAEMLAVASQLSGQLTASVHLDDGDKDFAGALLPVLEQKAGRVVFNGFPTGVDVCHAMVHGGPYPAASYAGTTSVGTRAIARFVRPVCYQDVPDALLPDALKDDNPMGLARLVNGALSKDSVK